MNQLANVFISVCKRGIFPVTRRHPSVLLLTFRISASYRSCHTVQTKLKTFFSFSLFFLLFTCSNTRVSSRFGTHPFFLGLLLFSVALNAYAVCEGKCRRCCQRWWCRSGGSSAVAPPALFTFTYGPVGSTTGGCHG